ncbi:MAG: NUDIX domain-containing protein [Chloroflexia bacterium]
MSTELIFGERIGRSAPIRLTVTGVLPNREGRLLLVQRADNGAWCLPGGGVDPGERVVEGWCARWRRRRASTSSP